MATDNLTKLKRRNILFDNPESEDEEVPIVDAKYNDETKCSFLTPFMGESYSTYADSYMKLELLERGKRDLLKFQESINGQLTQPIYELIRTGSLTPETLAANSDKWTTENAEPKYMFLQRRYYVDRGRLVRDQRKCDKVVCEPAFMFDFIICAHLMNGHMTYRPLHRYLNKLYSNVTRDFVQVAVRYCSSCNPDEELKPLEKYRHKNIFKGLLPFERIHLEVFEPFEGELIDGKYSHVLYCRDYHSRFVWLIPLKSTKYRHLVTNIAAYLLGLVQLPIYLETSTLDRQDFFDICEQICEKYRLKIGLGVNNSAQFHSNGVKRMKGLLSKHKAACLSDWNMCLKYGQYYHNRTYNTQAVGVPNDLICTEVPNFGGEFKLKQEKVLLESFAQNVVQVGKGLIYLEDGTVFAVEDEDSEVNEYEDELLTSRPWEEEKGNASITPVSSRPNDDELIYNLGTSSMRAKNSKHNEVNINHYSSEISEPSTSFYKELISPARKRLHQEQNKE